MKSVKLRTIMHYVAAALLALIGFFGVPYGCYLLFPKMSLLMEYLANAVVLIMVFALPALLIVSAQSGRWQRFKRLFKQPSSETAGLCMLCAVSATVVVSLVVAFWMPYAEMLAGKKLENPPLPAPQSATEWALALLCIAVVPAVCEGPVTRSGNGQGRRGHGEHSTAIQGRTVAWTLEVAFTCGLGKK